MSLELKAQAQDLKILYVEDEEATRTQVTQILSLFFKDVLVGIDGADALEIYKNNKDIDLILSDLTMPKMNGFEMIKEIYKIDYRQHVIVLTAHNNSDSLMQTIDLQIDGFLLKPLKLDKLTELLLKVTKVINLEKESSLKEHKCIH